MKNKFIQVYFWIGVNIIGLPDIHVHSVWFEPKKKVYTKFI